MLQAIYLFTFYFVCATLAFECPNCSQSLDLTSSQIINTNASGCNFVNTQYSSCSQELRIQYFKGQGSVLLQANPSESLVLSNLPQIMTNTTTIWLDKTQFERTVQISCFNGNACRTDVINDIYMEVRQFEYIDLWANLITRLYDSYSNPDALVCADNHDKPVPCPGGFCQLISRDSSSFSRSCVPKGSVANSYGVISRSMTMTEKDIESSVKYTCNKPMCNNLTIAKEVRYLLKTRELLIDTITTTTTTTTTNPTTTILTTTIKSSRGNTAKPMISIQVGLIFLMVLIFQL